MATLNLSFILYGLFCTSDMVPNAMRAGSPILSLLRTHGNKPKCSVRVKLSANLVASSSRVLLEEEHGERSSRSVPSKVLWTKVISNFKNKT